MAPNTLLDDLFLLLVVDGVGRTDALAHPALALGEPAAVLHLDGGPLGHRLREGDVDGLGRLQPLVELVGGLGRALLHAELAADALGPVDHGRLLADVDGEVAHVARHLVDLAVGHQLDVLVLGAVDHARREDAGRAVDGGEGLVELGHDPADGGLPLDDGHLEPGVGQVEGRLDAGHPAADDQDVLVDLHLGGVEGLELPGLGHGHAHDVPGLLGGHGDVGVDPGAVLADVGHLEQVGVEAALVHAAPEGDLVHVGRAGRHHDAVELLLLDGLLDGRLAGLGTGVHDVLGVDHVLEAESLLGHAGHVDRGRDVGAAVADEDAYPHGVASASVAFGPRRRRPRPSRPPGPPCRLARLGRRLGRLFGRLALLFGAEGGSVGDGPLHKRPGVDHVLLQHHVVEAEAQGDAQNLGQVQDGHLVVGAHVLVDLRLLEVQVDVAERATHHDGFRAGRQSLLG